MDLLNCGLTRGKKGGGGICVALFAAIIGVNVVAGCASGKGPTLSLEDRCRQKGLRPGSMAYAQCVHPEAAQELQRAQQAWDNVTGD